ncbi:hypothetical protein GCM10027280_39760 [Micromonospora polyrhachis]|uniref:Uncharacterized protein n=1 Tax=Micromonospora polyrhachis TaxID=1282883 RepID=A0A7W7ST23_9ACTN|nr:hypothetical protein [Micromonospora polyrhachis]MBB4959832.1 hypothetical protein [Micromonospora polyrhachis]
MPDPYRLSETSETSEPPGAVPPAESRGTVVRPLLWLVLVVSIAANVVSSAIGVNVFIGSGFGLVALASGVALIVHHYRRRRR